MISSSKFSLVLTLFLVLTLAIFAISLCFSNPLGVPGSVYRYKLAGDVNARPEEAVKNGKVVVSAEITLGPVVGKDFQWVSLSFAQMNGQTYDAMLLIDKWPSAKDTPKVQRYLWYESIWKDYLEYVNEVTGKPEMPRFDIWQYGWPQTEDAKAPAAFSSAPKVIQLQGWKFDLVGTSKRTITAPTKTTLIKLNPDLLIGMSGVARDVAGRHKDNLGIEQYDFVSPQTDDDWRKDIAAGMNNFYQTRGEAQPGWVWRTNTYVAQMYIDPEDWPATLYRSNYWGRAHHVDEPAIHNRVLNYNTELAGKLTPLEASKALEKRTMETINALNNNYGNRILGVWVDKFFGKGSLNIVERKYPVWEALWQSSWYEMAPEGTACGVVDEDFSPETLIESYNTTLGTQIPPTVENAAAIRIAVARGAARNFKKNWGTAIYASTEGTLNPKIDITALKCAYDAGATYFWHWHGWVGMSDSVVPYSYKRAYASAIRQFFNENPKRDMNALLHAAKACIVLPNGFTFSAGPVHDIKWLHLERTTPEGATYREILKNAGLQAEKYIRKGIKFDFAIDEPRFKPNGYTELVYCLPDGTLNVVVPGKSDQKIAQQTEPERPILGPMPSVKIELIESSGHVPSTFKLRAVATPGTGELAQGIKRKTAIWWEIYSPDNGFTRNEGEEISFDAQQAGRYKIRAAVVDVFGRPGVSEMLIDLGEDPREVSVFPNKWLFQKDPQNQGEGLGYMESNFADKEWINMTVPGGWEQSPEVGNYDGYGWYRVHFNIPEEAANKKLELHFEGIDEQGWVWLNGKYIGERTEASTGLTAAEIWDKPFTLAVPNDLIKTGTENILAVKVHDSANMGGIFGKVKLLIAK